MNTLPFMSVLPGEDAIKLANAIYQTYVIEEDSHLTLNVARLCEVFGFRHTHETIAYFKMLFEELNEPVVVTDFHYNNHRYKWLVLTFCSFEAPWNDEDSHIYIALNEIFLQAMRELMAEPYISFKD